MFTSIKHLCANNDTNGNPRRLYALINEDGAYIAAWDENYHGHNAVPGEFRKLAYDATNEHISVYEYNRIRKEIPSPDFAYEVEGYSHLRF